MLVQVSHGSKMRARRWTKHPAGSAQVHGQAVGEDGRQLPTSKIEQLLRGGANTTHQPARLPQRSAPSSRVPQCTQHPAPKTHNTRPSMAPVKRAAHSPRPGYSPRIVPKQLVPRQAAAQRNGGSQRSPAAPQRADRGPAAGRDRAPAACREDRGPVPGADTKMVETIESDIIDSGGVWDLGLIVLDCSGMFATKLTPMSMCLNPKAPVILPSTPNLVLCLSLC